MTLFLQDSLLDHTLGLQVFRQDKLKTLRDLNMSIYVSTKCYIYIFVYTDAPMCVVQLTWFCNLIEIEENEEKSRNNNNIKSKYILCLHDRLAY